MDEELKKNMAHMSRGVEALNAGKGVEHDIIEEDKKDLVCRGMGELHLLLLRHNSPKTAFAFRTNISYNYEY